MKRVLLRTFCTILIACSALCAQSAPEAKKIELNAKSFFPPEYDYECFVDVEALLKTRPWLLMRGRATEFGTLRTRLHTYFGVELRTLNQFRLVRSLADSGGPLPEVMAFSSAKELHLPGHHIGSGAGMITFMSDVDRSDGLVGGHEVVVQESDLISRFNARFNQEENQEDVKTSLFVLPQPKLLIYGEHALVASVLQGKRQSGVPSLNLLPLLPSKKPLAYLAVSFLKDPIGESCLKPFTKDMFPVTDPLTGFMLSLHVNAENKHVILRGNLRFKTGKQGPAQVRKSLPERLMQLYLLTKGVPQCTSEKFVGAQVFKGCLEKIQYQKDGNELLWILDLGPAEPFPGLIDLSALFLVLSKDEARR